MRLSEVAVLLDAEVLVGSEDDAEVLSGGGSDSVSDVLVYGRPGMLLLTGLTQPSVVRAAQLTEASGIVFVRGKKPDESLLGMAARLRVPVLLSPHSLYDSCGRLYVRGLPGVITSRSEQLACC